MKNMAFDNLSQRTFDSNGYLHIAMTPISKAMVCPYLGSELKAEGVSLEPHRIYYGLRDPNEIEKSVSTFNNLPVLNQHHPIDSQNIPKEFIIGSTGTDAEFDGKYLKNSMCIYDDKAIQTIEDGTQQEISCAYAFTPDFKSGTFTDEDGNEVKYDFIMKDLKGNHVALVEEGRAGHDVKVADAMPEGVQEVEDGGPGSGRKPGSRNRGGAAWNNSSQYEGLRRNLINTEKVENAVHHNNTKAGTPSNEVEKHKRWDVERSVSKNNRRAENAQRTAARLTPISSVDSAEDLEKKGINMEELEVKDGGPGSGRRPEGGVHQNLTPKQSKAKKMMDKYRSEANKYYDLAEQSDIKMDKDHYENKRQEAIKNYLKHEKAYRANDTAEKEGINMEEKDMAQDAEIDKRQVIDEIGGMLEGKVDEELWRTIIQKAEELAYSGSEDTEATDADPEEEEVEEVVEKEPVEDADEAALAEEQQDQAEEHADLAEKAEELQNAIQEHEGDDDKMFADPMYRKGFEAGMAKAKQAVDDATPVMVQDTVDRVKKEITAQFKAMNKAANEVKPLVGNIKDILAFDSANSIYKFALEKNGVNSKKYAPEAYKGMVDMLLAGKSKAKVVANDSAVSELPENIITAAKRLKNIH